MITLSFSIFSEMYTCYSPSKFIFINENIHSSVLWTVLLDYVSGNIDTTWKRKTACLFF